VWRVVKWGLCAVVLVFVGRRAVQLWDPAAMAGLEIRPLWVAAAAASYTAGWLPSVWFWRRLMRRCGARVGWFDTLRAYFCGHLGKYVPGKGMVLVIRSALLKPAGCPVTVSALTATFETLVMMGAGTAVAVALAPQLVTPEQLVSWPGWARSVVERPLLPAALVVLACAVLLPVLAQLLTKLAVRMTPLGMSGGERAVRLDTRLLAESLVVLTLGWALHGLSLGCTLRAVGGPANLADWPLWTAAASLSTVGGFLAVFAPAGIGVREGLLLELLRVQPGVTHPQAVAAPLLLRVVWFVTELLAAAVLYRGRRQ
jgi:uncharacterized membrane protein YbhN (UPF0104 family)